jgi:hypothetical protein
MDWNKILEEQEHDPGYTPVPKGKYTVRVVKAEAVKTGKGDDMLKIVTQVVGGPYDTKQIWTNIVFATSNPKAMRFTLRKLSALGVTREILGTQNPPPERIADMIIGAECEAEVSVTEYQGEQRNDIAAFRVVSPGAEATPSIPTSAVPPAPTIPAPSVVDTSDGGTETEPF